MTFKGTAALAIVFLVLGGFVYFSEFRGREARQQAEESKKKAIQIEQKDIAEISLIYPDQTITAVRKGEKQWEITSHPGVEADGDEWELLAGNIPRIEREDTVAESTNDLAAYGLTDPPVKVSAKLATGTTHEVQFGAENPRKIYHYAKLADSPAVFLTPTSWARIFTKTLTDLRNKVVLKFEADDINNVKIVDGKRELEVQKSGEDWEIKKPIQTKADNTELTTFISSVRFARASSFATSSIDAKSAGLDPPAGRITLHDGKANEDRILLIGKSSEPGKFYAKDASREPIFIIESQIVEKVWRPVFDWREKSISRIVRDNIEEVEIIRGAEKFSFKKVEADWKLPDGKKLQWDKVSSMLNTLEFDKAKEIIDVPGSPASYGLDRPKLEVIFRQGANEVLRLAFGSDKQPDGIYLKTSESAAIKIVSKDVFDKFNVKAEDLVEATASGPGN